MAEKSEYKVMRWVARILSLLFAAFWFMAMLALIITGIIAGEEPVFDEEIIILILVIFLLVGTIIAWWRERVAGILLVLGAIAFGLFTFFTAGRNQFGAALFNSIPFLLSGVLFLVCSSRPRAS